ncbi:MAG: AAA family ATPase, partial [Thermofilum sp.]|uniref:AAA family ATPase n=1 Tax=Thermofilum sp. TaxID=1961369 RepID=UPI0031804F17
MRQCEYRRKPAVTFAYLDVDGDLQAVRVRTSLSGNRFRWKNGARPKELLYGAWWLPLWQQKGMTRPLLVEGESDCLTLWQAGIPAVGVAGADCLSEQNASLLDGFEVILWLEPDEGGRKLLESAIDLFGDRLKVVEPPAGVKDANELWTRILREEQHYQQARERFKAQIQHLMDASRELSEVSEPIYMPTVPTVRESAPNLVDLGTLPEPPPQEWLVKDLIPARFITNLYADSGQGKSFLILHLALCCLTATPFCGKPVKAGKVLYLDWELDCDTTARRWYAVCRGAGFSTALRGLLYERMTKPLSAVFPYIHSLVQEHSPVLVVIDSLGKALGVDPRDPEKAIQAYNLLEQLPCAVLVIDHQGKLQAEDTYANKSEYGTAYKAHYARSRLQIERIGEAPASTKANDTDTSVDGQLSDTDTSAVSRVGIVIRHKKSNFGALQPDLHLVMTFTNDDEGNLHAVRFEHVQTADVEADALGARGEILLALREADRTVEELEQLIGLSR